MAENERGRSFDRPPIANRRQKRAINAITSHRLNCWAGGVNKENSDASSD